MTPENKKFIDSIIPYCQSAHRQYGVPASVTIAQAILESNWGRSGLTIKANNLFGIKADKSWKGENIMMSTMECVKGNTIKVQAPFRKYPSLQDSINDHALFLKNNKRYQEAFLTHCSDDFCKAIAKAGYATDPLYSNKLIGLIKSYSLNQYD